MLTKDATITEKLATSRTSPCMVKISLATLIHPVMISWAKVPRIEVEVNVCPKHCEYNNGYDCIDEDC